MKKISNASVLDGIFLFNVSEDHRLYCMYEFYNYFIYPLMYDRVRIWYEDSKPVGLFTYCFLSKEKADAFLNEDYFLQEEDYIPDDGDELWGVEFIAPYGHARKMVAELKQEYAHKYGKPRPIYWRRLHNPTDRKRGRL